MQRTFQAIVFVTLLAGPRLAGAQTNNAPLPSLQVVLAHAAEAVGRENYYEHGFSQHYAYERSRVTETHYSGGKYQDRQEKDYTNSPSPTMAALPLPPFTPAANSQAAATSKKRGKLVNITELVTNILAHGQMTMVGREMVNGRSALVVDFQPPENEMPEDSLADRLLNRAAGRAWVDEGDYTLIRLQAHLLRELDFLGGVAGAVYTGSYSFERERTSEGLWYARDIKYSADLREFILSRTIDYEEVLTNVHKPLVAVVSTTR